MLFPSKVAGGTLPGRRRHRRRGGSAVEFALVLPFLVMMLLGTLDLCRMFYAYTIVGESARNGALYASSYYNDQSNSGAAAYKDPGGNFALSIQNAALYGASDIISYASPPANTVASQVTGTSPNQLVTVTVTYKFNLMTTYLGIGPVTLSRSVTMPVLPSYP